MAVPSKYNWDRLPSKSWKTIVRLLITMKNFIFGEKNTFQVSLHVLKKQEGSKSNLKKCCRLPLNLICECYLFLVESFCCYANTFCHYLMNPLATTFLALLVTEVLNFKTVVNKCFLPQNADLYASCLWHWLSALHLLFAGFLWWNKNFHK